MWHNFTNSQRLLIILVGTDLIQLDAESNIDINIVTEDINLMIIYFVIVCVCSFLTAHQSAQKGYLVPFKVYMMDRIWK